MTARTTEPDPETAAKPRRQFGAAYKLKILGQMDAASGPKEVGAILRREGLYSSLVSTWRAQRSEGTLAALAPKKRGPKPPRKDPLVEENERLRKQVAWLERKLETAGKIIEVQKKVSELLGIPLGTPGDDETR
jgi:transposase-like protein